MSNVKYIMSKISDVPNNKQSRKNMTFIRIGTNSPSSYIKATTQLNFYVLPPLIKMRQLSLNFLNSLSIDISGVIY